MKNHSEEWFNRWEQRIHEPFKNTKIYNYLPAIVFIVIFIVSKDYYHGWQSLLLSIVDISIFFRFQEFTVLFLLDALVWLIKLIIQIIALFFFIKSFVNIARCKYYEAVFYDQSADYLGSARAVTFTGPPGCGKCMQRQVGPNVVAPEV